MVVGVAERTKVERFKGDPAALRRWQVRMALTNHQAASALGVGYTTYAEMLRGETRIDLRTALACAAIEHGLEPV